MRPSDTNSYTRAIRAYELGRAMYAARVAVLVLAFPVLSLLLGARLGPTGLLAVALALSAGFLAWHGRAAGEGLLPGILAGAVPFLFGHAAQAWGHVCLGDGCYSLCMPACVAGGTIAGLMVARMSRRRSEPLVTLAASSGTALLVGALGCGCVGFTGVLSLAVSLSLSVAADRVLARA